MQETEKEIGLNTGNKIFSWPQKVILLQRIYLNEEILFSSIK